MRSLPSFKYILNPKAQVNRPNVGHGRSGTLRVTKDRMRLQPQEFVFQPMEDGRIFVTPANAPTGHKTVLLPKPGTFGQQTLIDQRTGLPVPVVNAQSFKDRRATRRHGNGEQKLFPRDIGKTIVLNSPKEASEFVNNITKDYRYVLFEPEANPIKQRKAAERVLAYKRKRWLEDGHPSNILRGDVPVNHWLDEPYSDEEIDQLIGNPMKDDTVSRALAAAAALKTPKSQSIEPYTDIPEVQRTVVSDLRRALRGEATEAPRALPTQTDNRMTQGFDYANWKTRQDNEFKERGGMNEGFDYESWQAKRRPMNVPSHALKVQQGTRFAGGPTLSQISF